MASELEERIEHLENLLYQIKLGERNENSFRRLFSLLEKEYNLEGGESGVYIMGNYRHNLEQTIEKQAREYLATKKRRPVKGAPLEYESFVRNFSHDVNDELNRCKYKLNPPTSGE